MVYFSVLNFFNSLTWPSFPAPQWRPPSASRFSAPWFWATFVFAAKSAVEKWGNPFCRQRPLSPASIFPVRLSLAWWHRWQRWRRKTAGCRRGRGSRACWPTASWNGRPLKQAGKIRGRKKELIVVSVVYALVGFISFIRRNFATHLLAEAKPGIFTVISITVFCLTSAPPNKHPSFYSWLPITKN